ncbi:MAG: adenylosuccinate lyase [Oscillospiraceae bacterium]|nr:adenylosuccinate lyase [Oscillospiraceae bacterium]
MPVHNKYVSPFSTRYASDEMQYLFSDDAKFTTWRRLWVSLAKAEQELGLPVAAEQVAELEANVDNIDFEAARRREQIVRHDVMAHVHTYGLACPGAAGIIHLGATSCFVGDNADIIIMRRALELTRKKLAGVAKKLCDFAMAHKDLPCLGYTHLQPAQPTTVGKRATLWLSELLMDIDEASRRIDTLAMLGNKGTTGTQASFLELFEGDAEKVERLEQMIAADFGFDRVVPVSGQTYSRKVDFQVAAALSGVAQTAGKFAQDIRLLQSFKELEEPFESEQIGSSAMPYKRNPMRSERISALARHVITNALNPAMTASTQWLERSLDDSANRRIAMSEAFLGVDAILNIMLNICGGLVVYPKVIEKRLMEELPFMAAENIMMGAVKKGGDRQELHERLRVYSQQAGAVVKEQGRPNDLLDRIAADSTFGLSSDELEGILDPALYIGLAVRQTENFVQKVALPATQPFLEEGNAPNTELKV